MVVFNSRTRKRWRHADELGGKGMICTAAGEMLFRSHGKVGWTQNVWYLLSSLSHPAKDHNRYDSETTGIIES